MWLVTLVFAFFLFTHSAWGFECAGAKLPSNVVICSDPELIRLADERQQVFNHARWGLDPQQDKELWENQRSWVRSYATSCGVAPDLPTPKLPTSPAVRACFKRAAEGRIAFLRSYREQLKQAPAVTHSAEDKIGPGFDCTNAVHPLALMLCADRELAKIDLRFNQAYWALFQQLNEAGRRELKDEDVEFLEEVQDDCGVPRSGDSQPKYGALAIALERLTKQNGSCGLLDFPGRHTKKLPAPSTAISGSSESSGNLLFFTTPPVPEGVYGSGTRRAIVEWQQSHGRPPTGILGNADATALDAEFTEKPRVPQAPLLADPPPSNNLLAPAPPGPPPILPLVETSENRALLRGDDDDVLVLLNVGPAARIALNVRGEPVFPAGTLDICILGGQSLPFDAVDAVEGAVSAYGLRVDISRPSDCLPNFLDRVDVVVGSRAALRRTDRVPLDRLIADYRSRKLDLKTTILAADLRTARDHRARAARKNQAYLADPNAPGWGVLLIENNSQRLCGVGTPGTIANAAIDQSRRILGLEVGQRLQPDMQWMDADSAFIAARRGACRTIIAKAVELTPIAAALDRDKIPHSLSSEWIKPPLPSPKLVALAPSPPLAENDDNRWLLQGSPQDHLVLIQVGPASPNASVNLQGEPVFLGGRATICKVGEIADADAMQQLEDRFASYKLQAVIDNAPLCNPGELSAYDLLTGTRQSFLALPPAAVDWIIAQSKNRNIIKPHLISAADLQRRRDERELARANIQERLPQPTEQGWGFVILTSDKHQLCAIDAGNLPVADIVLSVHGALAIDSSARDALSINTGPADDLFIEAKRGSCRIIFAQAKDLKELIEGFARDNFAYRLSSVWVTADEITNVQKQAAARLSEQAVAQQHLKEDADRRRIERENRERLAGTAMRQETAKLQNENRASATAASGQLKTAVQKFLTKDNLREETLISANFPSFSSFAYGRRSSGWILDAMTADILDYGASEYQARVLETIFIKASIRMKNSDVGKYEEVCYVLGYQTDKEFNRIRDRFESPCDGSDPLILKWKRSHQYLSKWQAG